MADYSGQVTNRRASPGWLISPRRGSRYRRGRRSMVLEYVLDVARRVVRVRLSGILTADALRSMFDDIRDDARVSPELCTLIFLRDVRFVPDLTGETVLVVASRPLAMARQGLSVDQSGA